MFTFLISEKRNSVLFSVFRVTAAAKDRVNAEKMSSIKVIVVSDLNFNFECKVLYQLLVLIAYRGI